EVLRTLAAQDGAWIRVVELARRTHRQLPEVAQAVNDLTTDGVVEVLPAAAPEDVSYRLPADEPTSVVLRRLIHAATHSQELRASRGTRRGMPHRPFPTLRRGRFGCQREVQTRPSPVAGRGLTGCMGRLPGKYRSQTPSRRLWLVALPR